MRWIANLYARTYEEDRQAIVGLIYEDEGMEMYCIWT